MGKIEASRSPDVSVVMGVHNEALHLRATLESVLAQEGVEFEFVVVDDGSTDSSGEILAARSAVTPRLRVVTQPNLGLTEALRRGCREARGRYVARQDAADLSLPGRLRRQKEVLDEDPSLAFVGCWTEFLGPAMEPLYTVRDRGLAREPTDLIQRAGDGWRLVEGPSCHGAVMFRRAHYEQAGGYRSEFFLAQDQDLWYRMAEIGRYQSVPEVLYAVRVLPEGRSLSYRKTQRRLGALANEAFQLRREGKPEREVLQRARDLRPPADGVGPWTRAKGHYFVGEALRRRGDERCVGYFRRAVAAAPYHIASWVRWLQWTLRWDG